MILFALSLSADIQHGNSRHLCKFTGAGSCGHGNKRIITTAAGHSIELVLPPLEALFKFFLDICQCLCFRHICGNTQTLIFCQRSVIRLLSIRFQDQIHAGYGESAVLLAGCT